MKMFVETPDILLAERQLAFSETFLTTGTSSRGVITAAGTAAVLSVNGGGVALPTSTTDNSKSGWRPAGNIHTLGNGKTCWMGAKLQYSEANTNAANLLVGFCSTALASAMQNDGAGPPSSYTGAVFYKTDGQSSSNWFVEVSLGGTQTSAELSASNTLDKLAKPAAGSAYQFLEVLITPKSATNADVIFKIDGVTVYKFMDWVITSAAAMSPIVMIMAGSTTAETLNLRRVDYAAII